MTTEQGTEEALALLEEVFAIIGEGLVDDAVADALPAEQLAGWHERTYTVLAAARGQIQRPLRWCVQYTVRDGDDKRDEVEHDIAATTAGHALYSFLEDRGIRADTIGQVAEESDGLDNEEELAEHGWTREKSLYEFGDYMAGPLNPSLDFWEDSRIIQVYAIAPDATRECAACRGSGRVEVR